MIVYADLGCPRCAGAWARDRGLPRRLVLPPLPGRQQAPALAGPARRRRGGGGSRAGFCAMVDSLYADRGHVDDPHLWERAERLGLDLDRFERDRRSTGWPRGCGATSSRASAPASRGTPAAFRCRVPSVATVKRTRVLKDEQWPPTGRPEVGKLNEHV